MIMPPRLPRFLLLLLLPFSVAAISCGDEAGDSGKESDTTAAPSAAGDADVIRATIAMSSKMADVVRSVKAVDDIVPAELSLTAIVDEYIAAVSGKVSDPNELRLLEKDRSVKEASMALRGALDSLQARDPEAAALLMKAIVTQGGRIDNIGRGGLSDETIEEALMRGRGQGEGDTAGTADTGAR